MARPKKDISEKQVYELAKIQCTYDEMAAVLACHPDTLKNRFSALIEKARHEGTQSLRRKQYDLALAGDKTMLIWLGKQYLGQTDRADHRHEHKVDYGVMKVAESPDVTDWEALAKQQQAVMGGGGNGRKTAN